MAGAHIVIVNDDPFQMKVMHAVLVKAGYKVSTYEGVTSAFSGMTPDSIPDMIITDLHMPEIDGWRFCRLLRSQDYSCFNNIPILVMSATFSGVDAEHVTAELGANAFLPIPYKSEILLSHVESLLRGERPVLLPKVLIVDDSVSIANHLKRSFDAAGYETITANSGEEARKAFSREQPDVNVIDYHMPDALGDELLVEFKAARPSAVNIMITSDETPELALEFLYKGADGYIRKPFDANYLIDYCRKVQRERSFLHVEELLEQRTIELRNSEERYRTLVAITGEGMVILREGRIRFASDRLCEIVGRSREEIVGKPYSIVFSEDEQERISDLHDRYVAGEGNLGIIEAKIIRSDGKDCFIEINGARYVYDGEDAIMLSINDITERIKSEEEKAKLEAQFIQAQKMESVGRLAGGVAHDFNNLLTGITGNVQLAQMDLTPGDPLFEIMSEVSEAADRAAGLTRQLLAFSRKQIIKPKVIDLNELLENMHRMLGRIIKEDVHLKTVLSESLRRITADPGQMEQIIVNLAVNARDAMPNGGNLIIETSNAELDEEYCQEHPCIKQGRYVMMSISDDGQGMDKETQKYIFDPFFTTKNEGEGTGLGLSTVYGIVNQHGGHVRVYSELGQGTTFKIFFPEVMEEAEDIADLSVAKDIPRGNETIFVVEDDPMVRNIALRILNRLGYTVLSAKDGPNALTMIRKRDEHIDLLLTDIIMPNMNGRELAEELQKDMKDLKVIFTSGYSEEIIAHQGILDAGLEFIGKPYTPYALAKIVRKVLDRK